ncbi:unnamed protein product [Hanseniaspora opuntiae]
MNHAAVNNVEAQTRQESLINKSTSEPDLLSKTSSNSGGKTPTNWLLFNEATTLDKKDFLRYLGIPNGIKMNDTFSLLDKVNNGLMRIILKEESKDWSKFINRFEKDPDKIAIIERMVKELLAADNIKRSISNHSYTAFLVPKGKNKYIVWS